MIVVHIKKCARCDESHRDVQATEFQGTPVDNYDHWAMCPKLNEPVLIRVTSETV